MTVKLRRFEKSNYTETRIFQWNMETKWLFWIFFITFFFFFLHLFIYMFWGYHMFKHHFYDFYPFNLSSYAIFMLYTAVYRAENFLVSRCMCEIFLYVATKEKWSCFFQAMVKFLSYKLVIIHHWNYCNENT